MDVRPQVKKVLHSVGLALLCGLSTAALYLLRSDRFDLLALPPVPLLASIVSCGFSLLSLTATGIVFPRPSGDRKALLLFLAHAACDTLFALALFTIAFPFAAFIASCTQLVLGAALTRALWRVTRWLPLIWLPRVAFCAALTAAAYVTVLIN